MKEEQEERLSVLVLPRAGPAPSQSLWRVRRAAQQAAWGAAHIWRAGVQVELAVTRRHSQMLWRTVRGLAGFGVRCQAYNIFIGVWVAARVAV